MSRILDAKRDMDTIKGLRAEIARLQEQVEKLRQAIAGKDRQMYPSVTHGQYLEMAATLHAAREGGISRAEAAEAERDRLREENERLREACRIARLHAPIIRLAPERRHTISVLDAALQKEPQP